ncbi:hypothetical protein [Aliikangiella coralliicola]|uniref:Uncharacterized protein n=1 Tax=Aliikangiella coralliicola TaxID=2592383 RepID=A0A545UFV7_9GAMM|nr:hypothetical protein [Aliikangiella coralliicola]TQV88273.1 hypothetical protein FLL46_07025 [Aliikangiella coralliicola]
MHPIRKDFDLSKLSEGSVDISEIKVTFQLWKEKNSVGALIKISGKYGYGSDGAADAKFISWRVGEILDHPEYWIRGVVIDISELEYEWGDDIDVEPGKDIPYLVFLNEHNSEAYSFFIDKTKMRFHLRTALAEIKDKIKKI